MKRKLFAFDIDGTLLNSQKQPLKSTREALAQLRMQGHLVTIATGRSRFLANEILWDLDFNNYIVCNGSAAFLDHEQIYKKVLDGPRLQELAALCNEKKIDLALIDMDEIVRCSSHDVETMGAAMGSIDAGLPEYQPDYLKHHEVYQSLAFYNQAAAATVEKAFPEFRFVRWHEESVDVIPQGGSKAQAITFMAERLGIAQEDVITFGDGLNDLEMLRSAGVGVAMGNSSAEVQSAADLVTASNDQDGIWQGLKQLGFL